MGQGIRTASPPFYIDKKRGRDSLQNGFLRREKGYDIRRKVYLSPRDVYLSSRDIHPSRRDVHLAGWDRLFSLKYLSFQGIAYCFAKGLILFDKGFKLRRWPINDSVLQRLHPERGISHSPKHCAVMLRFTEAANTVLSFRGVKGIITSSNSSNSSKGKSHRLLMQFLNKSCA